MIETNVSTIFIGLNLAYVYIWVSKKHKVIYVGMTNGRVGTLGRAAQHLDKRGTLRANFLNTLGYSIDSTDDLKLLSFKLPSRKEFISVERSYREAVEFLVQKELLKVRGVLNPTYDVISWVRTSPRIRNGIVKRTAVDIATNFLAIYPTI